MDSRSAVQWIVAVLFVLGAAAFCPVSADPPHIYGGEFNRPIPKPDRNDPNISKGQMEDAVINITDHLFITDLDVRISITHTNVFDLQLFLESPLDTRLCLNMYHFEKEFSEYPNYTNTIFDDEAPLSIKQAEAPFTGRFRPVGPDKLSQFDGQNTYGPWRLQIYDAFWWDTGSLDSFEIMVTTPEPATAILLLLGTGLITLFKRPKQDL